MQVRSKSRMAAALEAAVGVLALVLQLTDCGCNIARHCHVYQHTPLPKILHNNLRGCMCVSVCMSVYVPTQGGGGHCRSVQARVSTHASTPLQHEQQIFLSMTMHVAEQRESEQRGDVRHSQARPLQDRQQQPRPHPHAPPSENALDLAHHSSSYSTTRQYE